jgi:ankyrin repeat protein
MKHLNKKLISAIYRGKEHKVLRLLKKGAEANFYDECGSTPLMLALLAEHINREIVELLIENGADVNAKEPSDRWTALHLVARDGHADFVEMLLQNGAEVDPQDMHGNTPLNGAVYSFKGDPEIIEMLLGHGADKNLENNYGVSPLGLAETIGDQTLLEILQKSICG